MKPFFRAAARAFAAPSLLAPVVSTVLALFGTGGGGALACSAIAVHLMVPPPSANTPAGVVGFRGVRPGAPA